MASIEGLKKKLKEYKPKVESAFVVYVTPRPSPVEKPDDEFTIVEVNTPDDPLLARLCSSKRQLKIAQAAMAEGRWNIVVALDADLEPAGRIWETYGTESALANGLPRMRLAADESLLFDLFVERKYRRSGIASTMAHFFFTKYDPNETHMKFIYGFVTYENVPSILWHHSVGFQIAQTMNYLAIGPFIKWKMPFSEMPRFGPMSRKGRHTDPSKDTFGPPLFP